MKDRTTVMIPPPVGPTVQRVAYVIRIGLRPRVVSRGLASCLVSWSSPVHVFIRTFLCCVSCVPPYLPLPAYYPIARGFGVVLVRHDSSCDYARGRPLSWYLVSHDGLCTTIVRTIVWVDTTLVC